MKIFIAFVSLYDNGGFGRPATVKAFAKREDAEAYLQEEKKKVKFITTAHHVPDGDKWEPSVWRNSVVNGKHYSVCWRAGVCHYIEEVELN